MSDLIERLEALTGPCSECDVAIFKAIGAPARFQYPFDIKPLVFDEKEQCYIAEVGEGMRVRYTPPAYTASIDAAMTLVPEGCMWNVGGNPIGGFTSAGLFGAAIWQGIDQIHGEAPTPAIALCIAALKAMTLPDTMQDGDRYE